MAGEGRAGAGARGALQVIVIRNVHGPREFQSTDQERLAEGIFTILHNVSWW